MNRMTTQSTFAYRAPDLKRALFACAAWFGLAAVLVLMMWPNFQLPEVIEHQDKYEHVLAFFVLGVCFGANGSWAMVCLSALGLSACAGAIELAQTYLVAGREGSFPDFYAGMAGAALGLMLTRLFSRAPNSPRQ